MFIKRNVLAQDSFTRSHFYSWVRQYVHKQDQEAVKNGIETLLIDHPDLIEKGYSWPEMRRLANV
jgi:hypothetical protein